MEQPQDFKSSQEQIQGALVAITRSVNGLAAEDLGFQRTLNPEVGSLLDEQAERLLAVAKGLLKSAASLSGLNAPLLEDADDLENNWSNVVDVLDSLKEKSDICLDEYTGLIKKGASQPHSSETPPFRKSHYLGKAFSAANVLKPQLAFEHIPDNFDSSPWRPILKTKPHAMVPLEDSLGVIMDEYDQKQYDYENFLSVIFHPLCPEAKAVDNSPDSKAAESPTIVLSPGREMPNGSPSRDDIKSKMLSKQAAGKRLRDSKARRERLATLRESGSTIDKTNRKLRFRHPYETEILHLRYPEATYKKAEPIPYLPIETTSATFVDTFEGVVEMLKELKNATVVAIDLEHHDKRSYVGLVSLMQISTRDKDWVVDTLKPWRQDLQILNEVFADPNIVKVFHGAFMDIVWLQRDLGLYVVGLFDTHHACKALGYAGGSLAFLLKKFVNFDADKQYQMADWRIRPLPEEMFFYARSDTHFLLFIYDNIRNELVEKSRINIPEQNRIELVLQKSKETSLSRHQSMIYNSETGKGPGGWYSLIHKQPKMFNKEQFSVFRAVHEWRDRVARTDDEGIHFVMGNSGLFSIAEHMPKDAIALLRFYHPNGPGGKERTKELLDVIQSARANGNEGPSMMEVLRPGYVKPLPATPSLKTEETEVVPVDSTQLVSENSTFWGGAFGSSIWEAIPSTSTSLRLSIPLPHLSEEVFASQSSLADRSKPPVPSATEHQSDEAFVIKSGTSKRKSEAISEASDAEYDITLNVPGPEEIRIARIKAEKKAEKKAKKALRKASVEKKTKKSKAVGGSANTTTNESGEEEKEEEEEEPFDYSKAESVLHGGKKSGGEASKKKKTAKPFDPYAKSADAKGGMRRLQTERPGKSHTFRN